MHNLNTVYRFEVVRTLKKKTFWISVLAMPVLIFGLGLISFLSGQASNEAADKVAKSKFSIEMTDDSNLVSSDLKKSYSIKSISEKNIGIENVKQGKVDAYYFIPANIGKNQIEVYAKDAGLFDNQKYSSVAENLVKQSAIAKTNPNIAVALQGSTSVNQTVYKNGKVYEGFKELIAPGIFVVLFYFLIAMFSAQTLSSTTEEKENRVIEMILTTIEAKTLVIGKILALITLSIIQIGLLILPIILSYIIFKNHLPISELNLSNIPIDWARMGVGLLVFIFGYFLYTGLLVAIGAASPTAKEANSYAGVVLMFAFAPLYAVTLFVSSPENPLVRFLSIFPLTSPIPMLIRNAVGNLQPYEIFVSVALLIISSILAVWLSVVIFKQGILEYSSKISLKSLFSNK